MASGTKKVEDLPSLQRQCVLAIRDGVENGIVQSLRLLPPGLRSFVLEAVLMHGTITQSNCLSTLSSIEFLNDITSLNTQRGNVDDSQYLERLIESIFSKTSIGEGIRSLKLNVYTCPMCKRGHKRKQTTKKKSKATENNNSNDTLTTVLKLITKCPNLESLSLRSVTKMGKLDRCKHETLNDASSVCAPEFLNDLVTAASSADSLVVIEGLKRLELIGSMRQDTFLRHTKPIIEFRNLSSLRLNTCSVRASAWIVFLGHIRNTLTSLVLQDVLVTNDDNLRLLGDPMLSAIPLAMPNLETLVVWEEAYRIDEDFVDKLVACPKLKRVELAIEEGNAVDEQTLSKLATFLADREAKIDIFCYLIDDPRTELNSESRLALIEPFSDTISSFRMFIDVWDSRFATALEHAMVTCENLETLEFSTSNFKNSVEFTHEMEESLLHLFDYDQRALKIRRLKLRGDLSEAVLTSIFKNCLCLKTLEIWNCRLLNDTHLVKWAYVGGRLSEIRIFYCGNVIAEGMLAVALKSADHLRRFEFVVDSPHLTDCMDGEQWRRLLDRCRFLEVIRGCRKELKQVVKEKCQNGMHWMMSAVPLCEH